MSKRSLQEQIRIKRYTNQLSTKTKVKNIDNINLQEIKIGACFYAIILFIIFFFYNLYNYNQIPTILIIFLSLTGIKMQNLLYDVHHGTFYKLLV